MFKLLYKKALYWAEHKNAVKFLACLSFVEAIFFPIPPDVMLAPMTMAKPSKAWKYALVTTLFSVLGGVVGFMIGLFAYHTVVMPILELMNRQDSYQYALQWFTHWGVWVVLIAAFTPIPYKVFTIAAGAMQMSFFGFFVASVIGRGARFYMVCALFKFGNKYLSTWIQKWIDVLGWSALILLIALYYLLVN